MWEANEANTEDETGGVWETESVSKEENGREESGGQRPDTLHCTALHCTILTALYSLHYTHCTALHCTALQITKQYSKALFI